MTAPSSHSQSTAQLWQHTRPFFGEAPLWGAPFDFYGRRNPESGKPLPKTDLETLFSIEHDTALLPTWGAMSQLFLQVIQEAKAEM